MVSSRNRKKIGKKLRAKGFLSNDSVTKPYNLRKLICIPSLEPYEKFCRCKPIIVIREI